VQVPRGTYDLGPHRSKLPSAPGGQGQSGRGPLLDDAALDEPVSDANEATPITGLWAMMRPERSDPTASRPRALRHVEAAAALRVRLSIVETLVWCTWVLADGRRAFR
jgi:hypothetical protein